MVVDKMIERGWLREVDANLRRGEPLWRETGDGHGTPLVMTDAGLLAIGIKPVVVHTMAAICKRAADMPVPKVPTPRAGTKQAIQPPRLPMPMHCVEQPVISNGMHKCLFTVRPAPGFRHLRDAISKRKSIRWLGRCPPPRLDLLGPRGR